MNKREDFTIEGSIPLKEAFVKESGLTDNFGNPWKNRGYLTSRYHDKKGFDYEDVKYSTHFKLPQQWDEALEYVKDYFTEEPEFKVGDWVIAYISDGQYIGKYNGENHNIDVVYLTDYCSVDSFGFHNGGAFDGIKRLATKEEILNHLQKEFTERTGIDVGSKVSNEYAKHKVLSFKLEDNNILCVCYNPSGTSYDWAEEVTLVKSKLAFRDNEVILLAALQILGKELCNILKEAKKLENE